MKKHHHLHGVYAITDMTLTPDTRIAEAVEQAIKGGCHVIQYRDKSLDHSHRLKQAQALKEICRLHNALFIINDDIELARRVKADGVHLGREDGKLAQARQVLGENSIIGISCYNQLELALQAEQEGADYVAFGSFFSSSIKPDAARADLTLLQQARLQLQIPIVAIGGIDSFNANSLINQGADMLAVISAIFAQDDIQQATHTIASLFTHTSTLCK